MLLLAGLQAGLPVAQHHQLQVRYQRTWQLRGVLGVRVPLPSSSEMQA